jgi:hypothetical protein
LLHYVQAWMTQIAQTAACNRHHAIQQRLCRCLLSRLDRLSSNELVVTQDAIAIVLAGRREGITAAAGRCRQAGLIRYHRGYITVLDRAGLEKQVCECSQIVEKTFDRPLPDPAATQASPAPLPAAYPVPVGAG